MMTEKGKAAFVIGSTGPAGEYLCRRLAAEGCPPVVLHRSDKREAEFRAMGCRVIHGDAMDREQMFAVARDAAADCDRVVTLLGGFPLNDPATWPDYTGNINVIDAVRAAGVRRVILVTSIGTGAGFRYVPETSVTRPILKLKTQAEEYLKATDLDWTIIKPGGLGKPGSVPKSGAPLLTENEAVRGSIDREELAELIARVVNDRSGCTRGKSLLAAGVKLEVFAGEPTAFEFQA